MSDLLRLDCNGCTVRGEACGDCVVAVLLGGPPAEVVLDGADRDALAVLADYGLVPPLRLAVDVPTSADPNPVHPRSLTHGEHPPTLEWQRGA